jgi:hypothetical protein
MLIASSSSPPVAGGGSGGAQQQKLVWGARGQALEQLLRAKGIAYSSVNLHGDQQPESATVTRQNGEGLFVATAHYDDVNDKDDSNVFMYWGFCASELQPN